MARTGHLAGLALLLLLGLASAGTHGNYLGCFDLSLMELPPDNSQIRSQGQVAGCFKGCAGGGYAVTLIGADSSCRCAGAVPPAAALLWDTECEAGGTGVAAFYNHADAATPCHVEDVPLSEVGFKPAYNGATNVEFKDGVMTLRLEGSEGTRVQSLGAKNLYGMYQVKGRIPCASGVVSAFYLRSSDSYANLNAGQSSNDFDELDFEFLSHNGMPCSVWLNTFRQGVSAGEAQLSQALYAKALGWPAQQPNSGDIVYTFHWQPRSVSWYMDGKLLKKMTTGEATTYNGGTRSTVYESPKNPMRPSFTMWTDTRGKDAFGGTIAPGQTYHAVFSKMRQVVCDASVPAAATVPAWLA